MVMKCQFCGKSIMEKQLAGYVNKSEMVMKFQFCGKKHRDMQLSSYVIIPEKIRNDCEISILSIETLWKNNYPVMLKNQKWL